MTKTLKEEIEKILGIDYILDDDTLKNILKRDDCPTCGHPIKQSERIKEIVSDLLALFHSHTEEMVGAVAKYYARHGMIDSGGAHDVIEILKSFSTKPSPY